MGSAVEGSVDSFGAPTRANCLYTPAYCEENIWHLCNAIKLNDANRLTQFRVIFISNFSKTTPMWNQRNGNQDKGGFVVWDYHVVLLRISDGTSSSSLIYDFDTTLSFPCSSSEYFLQAIRFDDSWKAAYKRKFRVIPADVYLRRLSSNRSHMKNEQGGWLRPPPPWPCIGDQENTSIEYFWSMDNTENLLDECSEVFDTRRLYETFMA